MICREKCFEILDDADLSGLISFLQAVSNKSKCSIYFTLDLRLSKIRVKVCCLKSKKVLNAIITMILGYPFLKKSLCHFKGERDFQGVKLFFVRDRQVCLGKEVPSATPYCIPQRAFDRHVLIVGSTGSGKSTTAKRIAEELRTNVLILDWHGEYAVNGMERLNCVSFENLKSLGRLELVDALASSLSLSDSQYYLLMKVVQLLWTKEEDFGIRDIIFQLKSIEEVSRWIRESKYALLKRLEMLLSDESCDITIGRLLKRTKEGVILDMTSFSTELAKRFIGNAILAYAFTKAKNGKLKKLYVFIEEAHNITPRSSELTIAEKVFMEGRKYGLHVVAITQSPKKLSEGIVKNAALKIIHGIKEVDDAKYLANSVGVQDLWREFIGLQVGEAYVVYRQPVKVIIERNSI